MGLHVPRPVRRAGALAVVVSSALLLASCSAEERGEWERAAMPEGASSESDGQIAFWQYSWIAALAVGVLVWGLIIFAAVKYRRRSEDEVPVQTRYNLPMELLYTVAPLIIVAVFFKFVIDYQDDLDQDDADPEHLIKVVGQQWAWTFNYVDDKALGGSMDPSACDQEGQETCVFRAGNPGDIPTLYLPVNETVKFELQSPDVIHDFWVPAFSYKLDVIPGNDNDFTMTPVREGTYAGKCAELCGVYHSRMLFNVEVVSAEEYAARLEELRDQGNLGVAVGSAEASTQAGLADDTDDDAETGSNE